MSNLYLVGFMGSGKTSVGSRLAGRLDRRFVDLDGAVEARFGVSIRAIFESFGEAEFRRIETEELKTTTIKSDLVVATGGGAFSGGENRRMIRESGGVSIFLDPPWEAICRRLGGVDATRPKWVDDGQARRLHEERLSDYRKANVRFDLSGDESPDEVAEMIALSLSEITCAS